MDMIERVARSIYISEIGSDAGWHHPRVEQNKELWLRKARAAIEAMREPTDEMVLVPRTPTEEMLVAAWAEALAEDPAGVWREMINCWLQSASSHNPPLEKA